MKTLIFPLGMVMIMLSLVACRSSKLSSRHIETSSSEELATGYAHEVKEDHIQHKYSVSDSNGHHYRILISPIDTFHLTPHGLIVGKASQIEITGTLDQKVITNGQTIVRSSQHRDSVANKRTRDETRALEKIRSLTKTGLSIGELALSFVALCVIVIIFSKVTFRKNAV